MVEVLEWLTPRQAAQRLSVTQSYASDLAHAGKLRAIRTGLGYLYEPTSVETLAQERAANPPKRGFPPGTRRGKKSA